MKITLKNFAEVDVFAQNFAKSLKKGDVIAFYGDLGSGKTFLTKAICKALEVEEIVSSPSYVILNQYKGKFNIFHYDLYRLSSPEEVYEVGLFDFMSEGISIIEWADMVKTILPEYAYHIKISVENEERILNIEKKDN